MFRFVILLSGCAVDPDVITRPLDDDQDGFAADVDCDDHSVEAYPDANERCDGKDNDCDGQIDDDPIDLQDWYVDADADDYGDPALYLSTGCTGPEGAASNAGDCDDTDAEINPLASEVCDDDIDQNCYPPDDGC